MKKTKRLSHKKKSFDRRWIFIAVGTVTMFALFAINQAIIKQKGTEEVSAAFNKYGYNYTARIFNSTYMDWCRARNDPPAQWCLNYIAGYENDKLVMKWNAEWDRGNAQGWLNPPYAAWEDNESNGRLPGGSGENWHYKIVWDQGCVDNSVPSGGTTKGVGYCIWGQFAVISSQGSDVNHLHRWETLMKPAGYGAYK